MKALDAKFALSLLMALTLAFPRSLFAEEIPDFSTNVPAPETEPNPPPPPPPDRGDSAGGANAGAIVGAAIAGAMCAMLMAQAAREQDPEKRQQLMMMAAQQCAQSAASAAAAGGNKEAENAVTQPQKGDPLPPLPTLPQENKNTSNERQVASSPSSDSEPEDLFEPTGDQLVDADNFTEFSPDVFNPSTGDLGNFASNVNGKKTLDPIDKTSVKFDDSAKGGGTTPQTPLGASTTQFTGNIGGRGNLPSGTTVSAELASEQNGKGRKRHGRKGNGDITAELASLEGSLGGGGSSSPGFDFDGAVAKLMKGGADSSAGGGSFGGGSGSMEITSLSKPKDKTKTPNIFEYASFRFRRAGYEDGLVLTPKRKREITSKGDATQESIKEKKSAMERRSKRQAKRPLREKIAQKGR